MDGQQWASPWGSPWVGQRWQWAPPAQPSEHLENMGRHTPLGGLPSLRLRTADAWLASPPQVAPLLVREPDLVADSDLSWRGLPPINRPAAYCISPSGDTRHARGVQPAEVTGTKHYGRGLPSQESSNGLEARELRSQCHRLVPPGGHEGRSLPGLSQLW